MHPEFITLGYRPKYENEKVGRLPDDEVLVPCSPGGAEALEEVIRFLIQVEQEEVAESSVGVQKKKK